MATSIPSEARRPSQHKCDICKQDGEQNDAEYYCEECKEYLCRGCREAHRKRSVTRGHELTNVVLVSGLASMMISSDEIYECEPCKSDSKDNEASLYCGVCKEYMCNVCGKHHGNYKNSKDHGLIKLQGSERMGHTAPSQHSQAAFLNVSPKSTIKVNVKIADDEEVPYITGCTFLSSGKLLLCDNKNSKLKLLNKSFIVSDSIRLSDRPWDIAVLDEKAAFVTLPLSKEIQYVVLAPKLSLGSRMPTKQRCCGIVVRGELIYTTCYGGRDSQGGDIRVLDLRGNELKTIGINRDGSQYLQGPCYIAANREGSKIYVTSCKTDELICMSTSGDIIYKLADIRSLNGLYVDSQDNVIVCGWENDIVIVATANGVKYKNLLTSYDGVKKPVAIAFRPLDSTLIVSFFRQSEMLVIKLA